MKRAESFSPGPWIAMGLLVAGCLIIGCTGTTAAVPTPAGADKLDCKKYPTSIVVQANGLDDKEDTLAFQRALDRAQYHIGCDLGAPAVVVPPGRYYVLGLKIAQKDKIQIIGLGQVQLRPACHLKTPTLDEEECAKEHMLHVLKGKVTLRNLHFYAVAGQSISSGVKLGTEGGSETYGESKLEDVIISTGWPREERWEGTAEQKLKHQRATGLTLARAHLTTLDNVTISGFEVGIRDLGRSQGTTILSSLIWRNNINIVWKSAGLMVIGGAVEQAYMVDMVMDGVTPPAIAAFHGVHFERCRPAEQAMFQIHGKGALLTIRDGIFFGNGSKESLFEAAKGTELVLSNNRYAAFTWAGDFTGDYSLPLGTKPMKAAEIVKQPQKSCCADEWKKAKKSVTPGTGGRPAHEPPELLPKP